MHAISHVTGGGLAANLARVLPAGLDAHLQRSSWRPAPVFELIAELGGVARAELEASMNMGVGMVVLAAPECAGAALELLTRRGVEAWLLGSIEPGEGTGSARLHGDHPGRPGG